MESLIPQVLYLGPVFAPMGLRLAAAIAYALLAHSLYVNRAQLETEHLPMIGRPAPALITLGIIATGAIAALLAAGAWTQGVAIVGFLGAVKGIVLTKRYPMFYPFGRVAYFLLAVICLALVVTGAGAFAFDKPF